MDPVIKQQASERLRQANNILVTVSANPSVDQLAALIGMTLLLNKLGKHTTAIFSGSTPSTLEFLQPEKTIEHDIDNLRDFIISLDKSKADKLHFKVEGDIVRIYITPYKTSLSEKDLSYGQGDYNVEAILALGVQNRSQIDGALSAHGRILHDATIIAATAGAGKPSDVGQINWQDTGASSLCEMMVSISESFGSGLIDAQIATALLTGIVAETERFRNKKTTPKVMTMSAQLMAAGANQQLIASKLDLPEQAQPAAGAKPAAAPASSEGTLQLDHKPEAAPQTSKQEMPKPPSAQTPPQGVKVDSSKISIDAEGNLSSAPTTSGKSNFVPAPADFTPPQGTASPTPPTQTPPSSLPDDIPLPGEHTLLDPSRHQPPFSSSFSDDTKPAWDGDRPTASATLGHEAEKQANSLEQARAAVEEAISSSPPQQPAAAAQERPPAPPAQDQGDQPAAAPPLPPPLPPSVIDSSSHQPGQSN